LWLLRLRKFVRIDGTVLRLLTLNGAHHIQWPGGLRTRVDARGVAAMQRGRSRSIGIPIGHDAQVWIRLRKMRLLGHIGGVWLVERLLLWIPTENISAVLQPKAHSGSEGVLRLVTTELIGDLVPFHQFGKLCGDKSARGLTR
jgi:hypothetical protein